VPAVALPCRGPAGDISLADIVEAVEGRSRSPCVRIPTITNAHSTSIAGLSRTCGIVGNAVRGALGAVRLTEPGAVMDDIRNREAHEADRQGL
jgi:DNA-binding IscR family transcriptional regulator